MFVVLYCSDDLPPAHPCTTTSAQVVISVDGQSTGQLMCKVGLKCLDHEGAAALVADMSDIVPFLFIFGYPTWRDTP
jgi:hypothetical protein